MNPNDSVVNVLFNFILVIGVMLVGMYVIAKVFGCQTMYLKALNKAWQFIKKHLLRFLRWSWREHKKFIIGTAFGIIATLYYMGHLA